MGLIIGRVGATSSRLRGLTPHVSRWFVWSPPVWPQPLRGCFPLRVSPRVARKLATLGFEPESLWDSHVKNFPLAPLYPPAKLAPHLNHPLGWFNLFFRSFSICEDFCRHIQSASGQS